MTYGNETWTEATSFPHLLPLIKECLLDIVFNTAVERNVTVNLDGESSFLQPRNQKGISYLVERSSDHPRRPCFTLETIRDFFSSWYILRWREAITQPDFSHRLQLVKNLEVFMAVSVVQFKIWAIRYRTSLLSKKEYYGTPEAFKITSSRLVRNTIISQYSIVSENPTHS